MDPNTKIMAIEEEVKLIKTEVKTVLIDLRELMNNYENPFVIAGPMKKAVDSEIAVTENHDVELESVPENEPAEPVNNHVDLPMARDKILDYPGIDRNELDKLLGETNIDIITLTRLMNWTDNAICAIGKDKLNAILDLYDSTGRLPKETKDVIIKIEVFSAANSAPLDKEAEMKECIYVLYHLDKIVCSDSQEPLLLPEEESELEEWLKV